MGSSFCWQREAQNISGHHYFEKPPMHFSFRHCPKQALRETKGEGYIALAHGKHCPFWVSLADSSRRRSQSGFSAVLTICGWHTDGPRVFLTSGILDRRSSESLPSWTGRSGRLFWEPSAWEKRPAESQDLLWDLHPFWVSRFAGNMACWCDRWEMNLAIPLKDSIADGFAGVIPTHSRLRPTPKAQMAVFPTSSDIQPT